MSLQHRSTTESVSENTIRVYFPAELVLDSAFPFAGGDPFVARTIRHEAVVLTPPTCSLTTIDLPTLEGFDERE